MKRLILFIIFLTLSKWSWSLPNCSGLTQNQYGAEVIKIMSQPTDDVDVNKAGTFPAVKYILRKIIKYRRANDPIAIGSIEDLASRCAAEDFIKDLTGDSIAFNNGHPGGKWQWFQTHYIDVFDSGDQF